MSLLVGVRRIEVLALAMLEHLPRVKDIRIGIDPKEGALTDGQTSRTDVLPCQAVDP
jgi:hypothetical protein